MIPSLDSGTCRITVLKSCKKKKKTEYLVKYEDFFKFKSNMGRFKIVKKIGDEQSCKLKQVMIKFNSLSHSKRLSYLKKYEIRKKLIWFLKL